LAFWRFDFPGFAALFMVAAPNGMAGDQKAQFDQSFKS
jgi:hypothetical protein